MSPPRNPKRPPLDHAKVAAPSSDVPAPHSLWGRLLVVLSHPTSGSSLAVFRMALGLVMALEAWSLCQPDGAAISSGATPLENYYTGAQITFHFPYSLLEWLPLLPKAWIHAVVAVQIVAGIMMAAGLFYRLSACLTFLSWGYLWSVESTRTYWQSHYYLELLLTFLMIWMPAARRFSLDARSGKPSQAPPAVPFWPLFMLRGQLVIAYFYAGLAKVNLDWILDAMPVRWFLAEPGVTEPFRSWLSAGAFERFALFVHSAGFAHFMSWTGLLFDLSIGFLLLWRRTRILGIALMGIFHLTNQVLVFDDIGWFPLVGFTTALIFLDADWPERFAAWVRRPRLAKPDWRWLVGGAVLVPGLGALAGWKLNSSKPGQPQMCERASRITAAFVLLWLTWQTLVPLRHYLIPGDGRFTYEGMSFSWRLKSEFRQSIAHRFHLEDAGIVSRDTNGQVHLDWSHWAGPQVLYRELSPNRIDWRQMPELVVLFEPLTGDRIFYNPAGASRPPTGEQEALDRATRLWRDLHGRLPSTLQPVSSPPRVLDRLAAGLRSGGMIEEAKALELLAADLRVSGGDSKVKRLKKARSMLGYYRSRDTGGQMLPLLRALHPFAFDATPQNNAPLLLLEDPGVIDPVTHRITPAAWKTSDATRSPRDRAITHHGADPPVIGTAELTVDEAPWFPRAVLVDSMIHPDRPPVVWWNSGKDLTPSKLLHTSQQPFFLRRYARRVADLWEKEHGRRPQIRAITDLSLNGRPFQPMVDPTADLASVPVSWFGHNSWVRDLEVARVPPDAMTRVPGRKPPIP